MAGQLGLFSSGPVHVDHDVRLHEGTAWAQVPWAGPFKKVAAHIDQSLVNGRQKVRGLPD